MTKGVGHEPALLCSIKNWYLAYSARKAVSENGQYQPAGGGGPEYTVASVLENHEIFK